VDLKGMGGAAMDCFYLAQDMDNWWTVVNTAVTFISRNTGISWLAEQIRAQRELCTMWSIDMVYLMT